MNIFNKIFGKDPTKYNPMPKEKGVKVGEKDGSFSDSEVNVPIGQGIISTLAAVESRINPLSYEFLNFYIKDTKYLANIFKIEGCKHIETLSSRILSTMVQMGAVALKCRKDKIEYWALVNQTMDGSNDIVKGTIFNPVAFQLGYRTDWKDNAKEITKEKYLVGQFDTQPLPLLLKAYTYYTKMIYANRIIFGNKRMMSEQFFRNVNHNRSDITDQEALLVGDPGYGVINIHNEGLSFNKTMISQATIGGQKVNKAAVGMDKSNTFEILPKPNDVNKDAMEMYEFFEAQKNSILGIRYNKDNKKERNVSSELDNSTREFELMEQDVKSNLERFTDNRNNMIMTEKCCNKKWKVSYVQGEMNSLREQVSENQMEKIEGEVENEI